MLYTAQELRAIADAIDAKDKGFPVEQKHTYSKEWEPLDSNGIALGNYGNGRWLYRPKPVPKTRQWSKPEDVPVCWVRGNERDWPVMIIMLQDDGVWAMSSTSKKVEFYSWDEAATWQYSLDHITWHPCEVVEE